MFGGGILPGQVCCSCSPAVAALQEVALHLAQHPGRPPQALPARAEDSLAGLLALSKDSSPVLPHQHNTNVSCCPALLKRLCKCAPTMYCCLKCAMSSLLLSFLVELGGEH